MPDKPKAKNNVRDIDAERTRRSGAPERIRVRVIQAHEIAFVTKERHVAGYQRLRVGDEIEIPESEFCANLHERI